MSNFANNAERIEGLTADLNAFELLARTLKLFEGKIALSSSFSAEDQVILDMLCSIHPNPPVFTLDTGRLPQETYDVIEATRKKYGIEVQVLYPDTGQLEKIVSAHGPNMFFQSVELRKLCCKVRKIDPLTKKLSQLDAWICGLRSQQSQTRTDLKRVQADHAFGLVKVAPLLDWTTEQVWDYIRRNDVPYNKLHDQGYPSIGCACCSRPVKSDDIRSGRWWWELPEHKECGIHLQPKDKSKKI